MIRCLQPSLRLPMLYVPPNGRISSLTSNNKSKFISTSPQIVSTDDVSVRNAVYSLGGHRDMDWESVLQTQPSFCGRWVCTWACPDLRNHNPWRNVVWVINKGRNATEYNSSCMNTDVQLGHKSFTAALLCSAKHLHVFCHIEVC